MFSRIQTTISDWLNQTRLVIIAILGIAIITASVMIAMAYISSKFLSILTTAIGCCLGMTTLLKAYYKLTEINQKKNAQALIDNASLERQLSESEKEKVKLELEKERLERMRIDVTSISPMLRLGLISVNVNLNDFMKTVHRDDSVKEGLIFKDDVTYYDEYIGVINKRFSAQLGIDLKKLTIRSEDDKIIVSGIRSEFQGYMNEETQWLLRELRQKKTVEGTLKHFLINNNDHRIQTSMIEQERSFKERINLGLEFKNLDNIIQEMAKHFICLILSPLKKEIVFVDNLSSGSTIVEFIQEQNDKISLQIKQLDSGQNK